MGIKVEGKEAKIMKCSKCGHKNSKGSAYCVKCGAELSQNSSAIDVLPDQGIAKNIKVKKPIYKRVWFWIAVVIIVIFAFASQGDSSDSSESLDKKVVEIKALYLGDTSAGVEINNDSNIEVTATYDDDTTAKVVGWKITEPVTLVASQVSTIEITYKKVSCTMDVACTTVDEATFKSTCQSIEYDDLARNPDNYSGTNITIYGQVIQVQESDMSVVLRVATKNEGYGYYDNVVYVEYEYKDGESKILEDDMITIWGTYAGTTTYTSVLGGNITIPALSAEFVQIG